MLKPRKHRILIPIREKELVEKTRFKKTRGFPDLPAEDIIKEIYEGYGVVIHLDSRFHPA
jgi:hypothetical protein